MAVTLAQIAAAAQVSRMTVSRALRQRPRVAPEVRERVLAAAKKLGWRPDPKLSRAMTEVRASARRVVTEKLALVWPDGDAARVAARANLKRFREGARARAEEQGFALEEFFLETAGVSARRLSQMIYARGMAGVVVAPVSFHAHLKLDMDWSRFPAVAVGVGLVQSGLSRVHNDHFGTIVECLERLETRGARRVGLVLWRETAERLNGQLEGAFIARHPLGPEEALRLLCFLPTDGTESALADWMRAARPDVIVGEAPEGEWIKKVARETGMRAGDTPAYATFNWFESHAKTAGYNQRFDRIGAAAVDVAVAQYHRSERGLAVAPKTVLTKGEWVDALRLVKRRA